MESRRGGKRLCFCLRQSRWIRPRGVDVDSSLSVRGPEAGRWRSESWKRGGLELEKSWPEVLDDGIMVFLQSRRGRKGGQGRQALLVAREGTRRRQGESGKEQLEQTETEQRDLQGRRPQ